ncbi:MAG: hypothetical protein WA955_06595 [Diaphorobacter nitroreducens]|uniref:hypothetical protein n=1 Tax=Diaphorobacter nitroreducens TaxID=164759 RepID=UPI0028A217AA|nr:hypothetical protein [Diaphorobacter nitroreducens]
MILVKTPAGQQALKDRQGALSPRQRSAFILFDGKRTLDQVLTATAAMGISREDVQLMIDQGLLESGPGASAPAAAAPADGAEVQVDGTGRTQRERYQAAYPIATELTASLGLKGFRLNLAVEGAAGYEDLAALAPKIREAVGDAKYTRLERALFA